MTASASRWPSGWRRGRCPPGCPVGDYGIRGYDLAYALMAGPDHAILVDACPRGEAPGTLYVIEPDPDELEAATGDPGFLDGHAMNPVSVLRLARSLGGAPAPGGRGGMRAGDTGPRGRAHRPQPAGAGGG